MRRIDDFIARLCPAGVPFRLLGDVASIRTGTRHNDSDERRDGQFAVFNGGVVASARVLAPNTDGDTITIPSRGSVGVVSYQAEPFWCGPLCYRIRSETDDLITRFLYYALKVRQTDLVRLQQTGSIPALNKKEISPLRVPTPPIEVQREIIRVLDAFSTLEAALEAELEARRKQYAYYREELLTFEEAT